MITVDGLTVEFGGTTLFKDISFQINEKDRIALMGKNGAGKSTLLKIIAGVRTATRGSVSAPKDCVIAYLPQHLMTEDGRTVFEETCQAFAHLHQIQAEIDRINNELLTRTDYDSDEYMQLIENVSTLSEKFYAIDMTHFEEDVEKTLLGLGFEREDFNRPTSEFSGGWRIRIELAKLLLKSPDVLLLDEPTNHLDIESIGWLEDFICNSSKAVVVISHDRKFVDDITTRTIEVTMGRIYDYKATYSQYLELRKERREQQMKQYEEQQKMIADTKEFIERFKGTYSKTLQVQSRVKMLEKLQLIEVDEEDTSRLRLKFPPSPRSGAYPVQMSDVAMSFDGKNVFSGVNLTVERGDKIAFVGRNGEGKSTLVKCIMGQLQNEGKLELGHNVQIGYFAQNQASLLDGELTVFQTIDDVAKGDVRNKIRDLLGAFMFGGEESTKKVKVLSGGERTRLAILKLLLEPVNLLILDEPTNHLDLKTKDVLKQALLDFDGTLIVVSHDRDFLDGLVSKVYEFGHGRVREHLCGIYEFLESKKMESLQELERNRVKPGTKTTRSFSDHGRAAQGGLPTLSETRRCPSLATGRPTRTAYSRCRAGCCCLLDCRQILHLSGIGSRRHRIPYSLGLPQEKDRCSLACTGGCLAMRDGRTACRLAPSQEWLCQRMPALRHRQRQACRRRTYGKCCALRWRQRLLRR